jgi:predicted ArsR family transcriptional regulator
MNVTANCAVMLRHMLAHPDEWHTTTDLHATLGLSAKTMQPYLTALVEAGWVGCVVPPQRGHRGRPARRYRMTARGIKAARRELEEWAFSDVPA